MKKTPTEHEVLNLLADISNLWHEIGLSLKVPHNILDGLKHSPESNAIKLSEVIHSWLTTSQSDLVTWETVIGAIKGPVVNNIKKATEIHQYLTKGKLIYHLLIYSMNMCLFPSEGRYSPKFYWGDVTVSDQSCKSVPTLI